MLVDCILNNGSEPRRCLVDGTWHDALRILFAQYGLHNISRIVNVDNPSMLWENKREYPLTI